jgi:RND superfamily putative drug exporter
MLAVFLAFGTADVASLRQFGVGLAIAVAVDATVIRLVLMPALLRLAGEAAWWPGGRAGSGIQAPSWHMPDAVGDPLPLPAE